MSTKPIIIWFRSDLRLSDHPALFAAGERPVIPVYIFAPEEEGEFPFGETSQVWLHHSLESLQKDLKDRGSELVIRKGNSIEILKELIETTGADTVFWTRRYEPNSIQRDSAVKSALKEMGLHVQSFCGQLLFEPWMVSTKQGKPYQVFSFFWTACKALPVREPLEMPALIPYKTNIKSLTVADLKLLPKVRWDKKLQIKAGENHAARLLKQFTERGIEAYSEARDIPALEDGVSHLAPHFHFGEISPYQVWNAVLNHPDGEPFLRQLAWREFANHLLYHFPYMTNRAFKQAFNGFKWETDKQGLERWQAGQTGYPIVDAGMRQLWETGSMHNRVRMITGSFLVKDLLINWQEGAKWFWDTLVDADLANNTLGWQWVGGMGADAAPYFRIFNPLLQGEKFDPDGTYVRRYVPELKGLSSRWIHRPFEAPEFELRQAGVILGKNYPHPIVDHKDARARALLRYKTID